MGGIGFQDNGHARHLLLSKTRLIRGQVLVTLKRYCTAGYYTFLLFRVLTKAFSAGDIIMPNAIQLWQICIG